MASREARAIPIYAHSAAAAIRAVEPATVATAFDVAARCPRDLGTDYSFRDSTGASACRGADRP